MRFILVITMLLIATVGFGQQEPMYSQYSNSMLTVNPAYAGARGMLNLTTIRRDQWISLDGAPQTQAISIHSPFRHFSMGLGASFLTDNIGPIKQIGVYFDYSYKIDFTEGRTLSFGLKGGFNKYELNLTELKTTDPNDPVFSFNINTNILPNFGVGALYHTNRFYAGLAIPELLKNVINKAESTTTETLSKEEIHMYVMAGNVFDINPIMKLKPYFMARLAMNAPVSFDLSTQVIFYDTFWVGAMYRFGDALGALMQVKITDQITLGYAYDFTTTDLSRYNNGTHEILLSFDFDFGKGRIRSPRYF
ncbi:type IX secretion system membrane protein PorP/SprF [Puteibacter caeruleilacunae]|nr:type IX secretion system membrane protein PorP/SprF [Puteibacter caeruleilacunae]